MKSEKKKLNELDKQRIRDLAMLKSGFYCFIYSLILIILFILFPLLWRLFS